MRESGDGVAQTVIAAPQIRQFSHPAILCFCPKWRKTRSETLSFLRLVSNWRQSLHCLTFRRIYLATSTANTISRVLSRSRRSKRLPLQQSSDTSTGSFCSSFGLATLLFPQVPRATAQVEGRPESHGKRGGRTIDRHRGTGGEMPSAGGRTQRKVSTFRNTRRNRRVWA